MRILGIDPGLITTGYGIVDVAQKAVKILEAGTIQTNPKDKFEQRLARIHWHTTGILAAHSPDAVIIEQLYAHHRHPATAYKLGHVRGVICLAVAQKKIVLVEQSVKRIRMALLGNGNATKVQVQAFVKRLLGLRQPKFALDTSDALALALGHAHMLRFRLL